MRHRPGGVGLRSEHPGITRAKGPSTSWDSWPTRSREGTVGTQECTQIGENGLSEPFRGICVHCCTCELRRVAQAPQPPWCVGGAPLGGRLSLGWENGLCVSTAAARLASSPRQQPTQTPEEPSFGHIRTPATSSDVPGPSHGPSGHPCKRRLIGPASSLGPGHHGTRLVEEVGPPRALGPCEARLPVRRHPRPSRPDRSIMAQRQPATC